MYKVTRDLMRLAIIDTPVMKSEQHFRHAYERIPQNVHKLDTVF